MSFLKVERKKSGTYLRLMESYRDDTGVVRHNILHSLGKVEDYSPEQLKRIGTRLFELGGGDVKHLLQGKIEEIARYNYGYYYIFNKIFKEYGLDKLLKQVVRKHKIKFDMINAVILMLIERLHDPASKRGNFLNQEEYLGIEKVSLQHLYRTLDKLAEYSDTIQQKIFQTGRSLFDQQLDIVFYDVTTLYFESEVVEEGSLRQKGFSKDGKIGNTQILFCMMIDKNKQPVGYRIFKGDTYEGHTFIHAIGDLKKQYQIDKIIVVADRGMLSRSNIAAVQENGYEFIVGEKIRTLPPSLQDIILDLNKYQSLWLYNDNEGKEVIIKYFITAYEGRTIIATYSQKRAAKDRHERETKLQTAAKLLKQPSLIKKKASRYFLQQEGEDKYVLDEQKIKQSEKYDGFLAIATNNKTLSPEQILEQYKQLYKIEHTFRNFKSHLETRPMFHWADKRIEGHICLCYIAYTLMNHVILQLEKQKMHLSESDLRKILDKMQVSQIQHEEEKIYVRSAPQLHENNLLMRLGLKSLPPVIPSMKISQYL